MRHIGRTLWAIPGGCIPATGHGREPDFTSHDQLCVLNSGDRDAQIEITIFYADQESKGPYSFKVSGRRTRHVRFNDLIDPEAMPLATEFAAIVTSDVPVVVQFTRLDSRQAENAICTTMAFPVDG